MPASHGEWVVGVVRGLLGKVADELKLAGVLPGLDSFASSCESFLCRSLNPARTAASSELTAEVCDERTGWALSPATRRAIRSAISLA